MSSQNAHSNLSETRFSAGDVIEAQYRTCAGYITDEWFRGVVQRSNSFDGTYDILFGIGGEDGYWWHAPWHRIRAGPIKLLDGLEKNSAHPDGRRTLVVRTLDGRVHTTFRVDPQQISGVQLKRMVGAFDEPPRISRFVQLLYGDKELLDDQTLFEGLGDDKAIAEIVFIRPCCECDSTVVCGGRRLVHNNGKTYCKIWNDWSI